MGKATSLYFGSIGGSVYDSTIGAGRAAQKEAERVAAENRAAAAKQADLADQALNKANAKTPDISGALAAAKLGALSGASGTLLTGTSGASDNLLLGKTTLLGQ